MNNKLRDTLIKNIDTKLEILYKNMDDYEYDEFIHSNDLLNNYNQLLNNISLNILPSNFKLLLSIHILNKVNDIVLNKLINYLDNEKELVFY